MTIQGSSDPTHEIIELKSIPGELGYPLVGNTLSMTRNPLRFLRDRYNRFGDISWGKILGIKVVFLIGPDANEFVLQNRDDVFSNNQGWDFLIGKFFQRGIMLLDFEEHRFHRKIMQSAFKKSVMMEYIKQMNPSIQDGIMKWTAGDSFHAFTAIKQLTLDLATEVFMGYELGKEADKLNRAFIDTVRAGTSIVRMPIPGGRWKKGLDGRKVLVNFFRSQIKNKRNNNNDSMDLFSQLCRAEAEDGQRFTDDDVVNHMIFLMMAAHDTSTITLSSMLYQLAKNPQWQERLRAESVALGKSCLEYDDLERLPSMTLVMKESLRLCAPVPGIPRKSVKDSEFKGYHIPSGTMIMVSPHFTHHMHEHWTNPFQFDPERFNDERREHKMHSYAYIPFGGGAHMCIGLHFAELQIKAILHQVLLKYRWSVNPGYEMPIDTSSLPTPKDKLPVKLVRL